MESSWQQPITNAGHGDLEPMALAPSGDGRDYREDKKYGKPLKLPTNSANSRNCGMVFSISLSSYFLDNFSFKFRFVSCIFFLQEKIKQTVPPNHCLELLARSETGFQVRVGDVFSCCTKPIFFWNIKMTSGLLKEGALQSTLLKAEHIHLLHLRPPGLEWLRSNLRKFRHESFAEPGSLRTFRGGETCRSGLSCKGCLESGRNRHRWRIPYYIYTWSALDFMGRDHSRLQLLWDHHAEEGYNTTIVLDKLEIFQGVRCCEKSFQIHQNQVNCSKLWRILVFVIDISTFIVSFFHKKWRDDPIWPDSLTG